MADKLSEKLRGGKILGRDFGAIPLANPRDIIHDSRDADKRLDWDGSKATGGYVQDPTPSKSNTTTTASLSGPAPSPGKRGAAGSAPRTDNTEPPPPPPDHVERTKPKLPPRKLTPDEMKALADKWLADIKTEEARSLAAGPSVRHLEHGSKENGYTTRLSPAAEKAFQAVRAQNRPWDTGEDYDLRGAYAAGSDLKDNHLTDEYKRPNHPTFSNESRYSQEEPEKAGRWQGERFVPPRAIQVPERSQKPVVVPSGGRNGAIRVEAQAGPEGRMPVFSQAEDLGDRAGQAVVRFSPTVQQKAQALVEKLGKLKASTDKKANGFMEEHPGAYGVYNAWRHEQQVQDARRQQWWDEKSRQMAKGLYGSMKPTDGGEL